VFPVQLFIPLSTVMVPTAAASVVASVGIPLLTAAFAEAKMKRQKVWRVEGWRSTCVTGWRTGRVGEDTNAHGRPRGFLQPIYRKPRTSTDSKIFVILLLREVDLRVK